MKKYFFVLFLFLLITVPLFSILAADDAKTPCEGGLCLTNPMASAGITSPQTLIGAIINKVMGVVGSIALLMFVYGGLVWMTSSGNADKVKSGQGILTWSAIGLMVIFSAYSLTKFVIDTLAK